MLLSSIGKGKRIWKLLIEELGDERIAVALTIYFFTLRTLPYLLLYA